MVTIATWNVENLFTPSSESGPSSASAYRDKLQALAATMTAADAEVWALQEVGEQQALDDLVAELDGDWRTVVSGGPDGALLPTLIGAALPEEPERRNGAKTFPNVGAWSMPTWRGRGIANAFVSKLVLHDPVDVVDLPPQLSGGRVDDDGAVLTRLGRGALQVRVRQRARP